MSNVSMSFNVGIPEINRIRLYKLPARPVKIIKAMRLPDTQRGFIMVGENRKVYASCVDRNVSLYIQAGSGGRYLPYFKALVKLNVLSSEALKWFLEREQKGANEFYFKKDVKDFKRIAKKYGINITKTMEKRLKNEPR